MACKENPTAMNAFLNTSFPHLSLVTTWVMASTIEDSQRKSGKNPLDERPWLEEATNTYAGFIHFFFSAFLAKKRSTNGVCVGTVCISVACVLASQYSYM